MKKVYIAMAVDFLHPGHINIIEEARKLGEVTIGLLTDEAIVSYKKAPVLNYEERKCIFENIRGVEHVIAQHSAEYTDNLRLLRPDYVLHGDDWKYDARSSIREHVIETLKEWGGTLVEIPATEGFSSTELLKSYLEVGVGVDKRRRKLKQLFGERSPVRCLEVHNGLSALIVEKTKYESEEGLREFDAMWLSSLTDSAAKGMPDTASVKLDSRLHSIEQIFNVTSKPLIVDGDNGGTTEEFRRMVINFEKMGVSAVIIEDKIGPKRNSLFGASTGQLQDSVEDFSNKIAEGCRVCKTKDFFIIARIESLILKAGLEDALQRARAYIEAGAEGIMIHSKEAEPTEILEFCREYKAFSRRVPLVVVPSTYHQVTEAELKKAGVSIVIYANHLIRSAYPAMVNVAEMILKNQRAFEAQESCMPIDDIITLIPERQR